MVSSTSMVAIGSHLLIEYSEISEFLILWLSKLWDDYN